MCIAADPECAPELAAQLGALVGRLLAVPLSGTAPDQTRARAALQRAKEAGTDLGPLSDAALAWIEGHVPAPVERRWVHPRLGFDRLFFMDGVLTGVDWEGVRPDDPAAALVGLWALADPALRDIALEAAGQSWEAGRLTWHALAIHLESLGDSPSAEQLEDVRQTLHELLQRGAGPRITDGLAPRSPRPDRILVRRVLQALPVDAASAAGALGAALLAARLPDDIGPRILRLGGRLPLSPPRDSGVPSPGLRWIADQSIALLDGAVSASIRAHLAQLSLALPRTDAEIWMHAALDAASGAPDGPYREASAALGLVGPSAPGIGPAATGLADLDQVPPLLPAVVLALAVLGEQGRLPGSAEAIVQRLLV